MAGLVIYYVLILMYRVLGRRRGSSVVKNIFGRTSGGLRIFLPLLGLFVALKILAPDAVWAERLSLAVSVLLIISGAYILIRFVYGFEDFIETRLGLNESDNLEARRTFTQIRLLRRVLIAFISFTAIVVILLFLPGAREIGAGLLASAGIAGLVIGIAAQKALGNLLAGFQIAMTQPIRIDDVVVVEGEWGRVEEITLTYVVIRIWDERRLILPISYLLEKPFTNWTRESAEILGTVFLYTDYTVPVDALRAELDRIVEASTHWDGRVKGLVVTDSKPNSLELRALVSAKDGGAAWDLRCEVREGLIGFLQREYPDALPKIRAELSPFPD
jgi:small-conductance mechanosensitive channel